jgi:hypothetical protein
VVWASVGDGGEEAVLEMEPVLEMESALGLALRLVSARVP